MLPAASAALSIFICALGGEEQVQQPDSAHADKGDGIKQETGMIWGEGSGVLEATSRPSPPATGHLHPGYGMAPGSREGAAGAPWP